MKKFNLFLILPLVYLTGACEPRTERAVTVEEDRDTVAVDEERRVINVYPLEHGHEFRNARLRMNSPEPNANIAAGNVNFRYEVENFNLGERTPDAGERGLADSEHGQHIHLILNNRPYTAHYEAEFQQNLEEGHHVALSFLSRSYHESLKDNRAYVLRQFTVGQGGDRIEFDEDGKHLFYSRPKDDYSGADAERIMLDFYLVNVKLSESGNRVRATINGEEFTLTQWRPYAIEGLPDGQATIRLELIDNEGNLIEGPFNRVERTINVNRQGQTQQQPGH